MPSNPFSFIEKLNLDNLYPVAPRGKIKRNQSYPLFERFKQEMNDPNILNEDRGLQQLLPREYTNPTAPRIESTKPMDVVFNENNISEATRAMGAARTIHGIDLNKNALSPYQAGQLSLRDREIEQRSSIAQGKSELDAKKVSIADFKARNRDHKFIQGEDGKLRAVNPLTKEVTDLGVTGMSQQEIAALNQTNDLQKIDRTGEQSRELETLRQSGDVSLAELKARHSKELASHQGTIKSDAERNSPILPSQERIAKLTRAEEARNSHPEWKNYIKIVPGGGFVITAPGMLFGPSRETYDAINKFIEAPPEAIRTVPTSGSSEINISPSAAGKPKSRYQVEVRDSK